MKGMMPRNTAIFLITAFLLGALPAAYGQQHADTARGAQPRADTARSADRGSPVVFYNDTLLTLYAPLGPFSARQRAEAVAKNLKKILVDSIPAERIQVAAGRGYSLIAAGDVAIMAVTDSDAAVAGKSRDSLGIEYAAIFRQAVAHTRSDYSLKSILIDSGITALFLLAAFFLFWALRALFPKGYRLLESWTGSIIPSFQVRSHEIISAENIAEFLIFLLKGLRLLFSIGILYFVITYPLSLFPWTRPWNVKPILVSIGLAVLVTVIAAVLVKSVRAIFAALRSKIESWKGTLIKPLKVKDAEFLSEDRIGAFAVGVARIMNAFALLAIGYFYITVLFSFFTLTQTWAGTLIGYIVTPLWAAFRTFIAYLPNLFFILVTIYVTRLFIKFIRFVFDEIARGTLTINGFFADWARPTYKITRFLIIAFAGIVIFPYLPGSSSPIFQGISVFLGILFSLGSTSAISNIVAGVVITYMRPFKIGDRVKIADTVGDIIEKTLLVTRVRTIKNVEITIPNSMVLGSHIVNFSSSVKDKRLIVHTGVTIGYDAPWKDVHAALLAAAEATENVLKEPPPFVLQTGLDDFYVRYELNAYTDKPNLMAVILSELHQHIQDAFNERGIEITSPHYAAVRDGNTTAIPDAYLPSGYSAPGFRISPLERIFGRKTPPGAPDAEE